MEEYVNLFLKRRMGFSYLKENGINKRIFKNQKEEDMKKSSIFMTIFFSVLGLFVWVAGTQAADNMTGTWNCVTDHSTRKGTATLVLQQNGEKITGQYQSSLGKFKIDGSSQGSDFELYILAIVRGIPTSMIFKGKIDGDIISGVMDMRSLGKGTFTGERVK